MGDQAVVKGRAARLPLLNQANCPILKCVVTGFSVDVHVRVSFPAADYFAVSGYGFGLIFGFLGFDRFGDQLVPFGFDLSFSVLFHKS